MKEHKITKVPHQSATLLPAGTSPKLHLPERASPISIVTYRVIDLPERTSPGVMRFWGKCVRTSPDETSENLSHPSVVRLGVIPVIREQKLY